MIKISLKKSTQLQLWEFKAPSVLALVQIIIATAGTSAYAKRTFSLARRLKSHLRSNMGDDMFDALGLMGWYKEDIDKMLDLVHIGNEYIEDCKDDSRSKHYGKKFTKEDFDYK